MPVQTGNYTNFRDGSSTFRDSLGFEASTSIHTTGLSEANMTAILGGIGNLSNAAQRKSSNTASAVVLNESLLFAFDEAVSSVGIVAVMKFFKSGEGITYIEIPAPDMTAFLPGQQFLDPEQTQVAAIITAMSAGSYAYQGSYVTTRKNKGQSQKFLPITQEPESAQLPSGAPDADNASGVDGGTDPED